MFDILFTMLNIEQIKNIPLLNIYLKIQHTVCARQFSRKNKHLVSPQHACFTHTRTNKNPRFLLLDIERMRAFWSETEPALLSTQL